MLCNVHPCDVTLSNRHLVLFLMRSIRLHAIDEINAGDVANDHVAKVTGHQFSDMRKDNIFAQFFLLLHCHIGQCLFILFFILFFRRALHFVRRRRKKK